MPKEERDGKENNRNTSKERNKQAQVSEGSA